jgi:hypothetical protein
MNSSTAGLMQQAPRTTVNGRATASVTGHASDTAHNCVTDCSSRDIMPLPAMAARRSNDQSLSSYTARAASALVT